MSTEVGSEDVEVASAMWAQRVREIVREEILRLLPSAVDMGSRPGYEISRSGVRVPAGVSGMPLEVFEFDGAELRTASLHGEPAVVLSDLAKLLGYRSASDAGRILRDHHRGYAEVRTFGGTQTMLVVTEQGMNRLLMRSNASNAERVQDWLSDEVMPSIRRTGAYVVPETPEQFMARAVLNAQEIIARKDEQIAVLAPKAEAWEEIADAGTDYAVRDVAPMLNRAGIETGPQRLFEALGELGWIYRGE